MLGERGGAQSSAPCHAEGRSAGDLIPGPWEPFSTPKTTGPTSQVVGGTFLSARPLPSNFIMADPVTKFAFVQELVKSWDLATSGTSEPLKVTEDKVAMAEAFARGVRAAAER